MCASAVRKEREDPSPGRAAGTAEQGSPEAGSAFYSPKDPYWLTASSTVIAPVPTR